MSNEIRTASGQDLRAMLEELYLWYYNLARKANRGKRADNYAVGKLDGAIDMIGCIYLNLYGGKAMYALWQGALADCEAEDKARKDGKA